MKTRHYTALATLLTAMAIVGCTTPNRGASSVGEPASVMQRPVQGTSAQNSGTQIQKDPSSMTSMQGMDHSKMGDMKGMDHSKMGNMKGMDHSKMGNPSPSEKGHASSTGGKNAGAEHGATAAGQAGIAAKATRTVNVKASDTMRFDPQSLQVKAGETIRFVVTNVGKLPHEFVIGTPQEQKAHAQMMQKMPGMKHEESNALSLAAGETKTLVWQFSNTQLVELACHVPGHYPAGMVSKVTVTPGR